MDGPNSDRAHDRHAFDRVAACKARIQHNTAELAERFRTGTPVADLIRERTAFIDHLLSEAWDRRIGRGATDVALVAVGGYGRGELLLHSDVDLLILLDEAAPSSRKQDLSDFLRLLWDIGLKPGHSVRSPAECAEAARTDQTIITNLLEGRLLVGSAALWEAVRSETAPERMWSSAAFFEAKMAEQRIRYSKYHNTAYNLEPNVKEGPGGLRDIQLIGWIIRRHSDARGLQDLVAHGWLTDAEYRELKEAQAFLWRIRFALHALTGRCEDRLLFDYQRELAGLFGYRGETSNEVVEGFMQDYFRTVTGVERLNELLLQLFNEAVLHRDDAFSPTPVNDHFQAVNDYLEAVHPAVFREHPLALLEVFLILQKNSALEGVRAATIRLIRQHIHLIDDAFRNDPEACRLFMDILRQPGGVTHQLRRMNRYGVLAAYLPEFGRVVGRMQYDLFHVYTVDEHTLFVVRNLRRFALEEFQQENPLCYELFQLIEKPELLYIAALMHDIAKGSDGDHSEVGERIAEEFCRRHRIGPRETLLVKWLVRHHLVMSMTAQRKDLSDPEVIHEFAQIVRNQNTLNHLYLLTVADIRATNPSLWNSWKGALLQELYTSTSWTLRRGLDTPPDYAEQISAAKDEARTLLQRFGLAEDAITAVWENIGDDYFLRFLPEEIAWHTTAIAACQPEHLPLVLLRPESLRGSAEVFIYERNRDFLFAQTTAVLDQLGLTVLDAKIIASRQGFALLSFNVLERSGTAPEGLFRLVQICDRLKEALSGGGAPPPAVSRLATRQIRHFTVPTKVFFHDDPQNRFSILELIATDRPGLLSKVGQAFMRTGIRLHNAKISTVGSRAEDIFFITDREDRPLNGEADRAALRRVLIEFVGDQ
ncbi:[protein-PII] uridylyltransferase [Methylococcus capsulatus]|uniref:[protein-PII] uridylyltransferase n=1 Tax=Methylococcus capsulatus TaxID=414 RepID=UPI002FDB01A8